MMLFLLSGLSVLVSVQVIDAWLVVPTQKFKFDRCCEATYGTQLFAFGKTSSKEECSLLCDSYAGCVSFLYRKTSSRCMVNSATFPGRTTTGCLSFDIVDYGEVTTLDPLRFAPLPQTYCMGACTNEVAGFRLCDGNGPGVCHPKQGRIEVMNGVWGTVCDDWWEFNAPNVGANVNVTCSMFGYNNGGVAQQYSYFGQGTGDIWLDDLQCTGEETNLVDCYHPGFGIHNCAHSEDVGVQCN